MQKITVNGKEYHSVDEMPPDVRSAYDQAMAALAGKDSTTADPGRGINLSTNVTVKERFIVNGREYSSLDEVPPEARSAIEAAMAKNRPSDAFAHPSAALADPAGPSAKELERTLITTSAGTSPGRTRLIVIAVLGAVLLLLLLLKMTGRV